VESGEPGSSGGGSGAGAAAGSGSGAGGGGAAGDPKIAALLAAGKDKNSPIYKVDGSIAMIKAASPNPCRHRTSVFRGPHDVAVCLRPPRGSGGARLSHD
jgi:hypothetical protein